MKSQFLKMNFCVFENLEQKIIQALVELTEELRAVFLLADVIGQPIATVAATLKISEAEAGERLSLARIELKRHLQLPEVG